MRRRECTNPGHYEGAGYLGKSETAPTRSFRKMVPNVARTPAPERRKENILEGMFSNGCTSSEESRTYGLTDNQEG
jgi:hypothetical protein